MKKILFLPFLQMRSGHHQVAEALMDMVETRNEEILVKKVDLLSYANPFMEKMVTSSYLNWIRFAPDTYDFIYKKVFFSDSQSNKQSYKWYSYYFMKKMEKLLSEEKPDLIICSHGFPSYVLNQLKGKNKCSTPVVNVYTDFFVNSVWGREEIEYHFLPSKDVKEEFNKLYKIQEQRLIVTGIPVHQEIAKNNQVKKSSKRPKILISGGNNGLGGIEHLLGNSRQSSLCDFYVLCGKNTKLFDELTSWQVDHIKPLRYISSREEMNHLYEEMDAIVTKPGGVTVSEALQKQLPVFVQSVLPGQEEINMRYLTEKGLVYKLKDIDLFEEELLKVLKNNTLMCKWEKSIQSYQNGIEMEGAENMVNFLNEILNLGSTIPASEYKHSKGYQLARA